MSLSTDPRPFLCQRRVQDFHRAQIVEFVSFTGAFASKRVVKSVKETCETVHSIPKETCQHTTQFDRPCKTACCWGIKGHHKMRKSVIQECDPELCKFVGYFHVLLPVTCDVARGLQCPKETCKRCTEHRFTSFNPTRTHVDRT